MIVLVPAIFIAGLGIGAVLGINGWVKWRDWQIAIVMSQGGGSFRWAGMDFDVDKA
jgi:hypothetical protein